MGKFREKLAGVLAPNLMNAEQAALLVDAAVKKASQAMLPVRADFDPRNEGYRRLTGDGAGQARLNDFSALAQETMLELAYYLYDTSGLVKRFVRDTKNFVMGEGISLSVENDDDKGSALAVLERFWHDPMNQMDIRMEKRIEFFGLLGEQCWPVSVSPHTGQVWLTYADPANIDTVHLMPGFPEIPAAVRLKGSGARIGRFMETVRQEMNPRKPEYGRLTGECFYFSVNNPPNSPRGRSDMIHLFDFINGFEEGLFDELDRLKGIKSFIWDVTVNGADQAECDKWVRQWSNPKSNSIRVHNEQVSWQAVAPSLNQHDNKALFDLMKTYLSACMNRPDSWLGSGGKAYQNEADLMGEPTFKDLGSRQRYVKYAIESVLKFVLDQAILAGTLKEDPKAPLRPCANFPEMTSKDTQKLVAALVSLSQALTLAVTNKWLSNDKAAEIYASVAGQVGVEIDVAEEIKAAAGGDDGGEDYDGKEALITEIIARIDRRSQAEGAEE